MPLDDLLLDRFGYRGFRPGQRDICAQVSDGRDALVVMPTGSGKSLCYQLPALARGGTTLVVSPLIALMKDQVDALNRHGIRATYINSSISPSERAQRTDGMAAGEWELVYVAPERFQEGFLERLKACDIRLLAIDEAHCLSSWGHDFRPDYLRLGRVRQALGDLPTVALTATATPRVQDDIVLHLGLEKAQRFILGFDRENLRLEVQECRKSREKAQAAAEIVRNKRAIVYAATRKNVEKAAAALNAGGICADFYHAGMEIDARNEIQEAFMSGSLPVVVATNAFGMGVDKADIRAVVHWDIPGTLEAYYQEIGRAGRDGQPARCVLLHGPGDRRTQEFFIQMSHPPVDLVHRVYSGLLECGENPVFLSRAELASKIDHKEANERSVSACLSLLEREGWLIRMPRGSGPGRTGGMRLVHPGMPLEFDESKLQARRELEYRKLESMVDYTRSPCRRRYILEHFGEAPAFEQCGTCDACTHGKAEGLKPRLLDAEETTVVRKALSCIARMRGAYSPSLVAKVLSGSQERTVRNFGFSRLSTHGILSDWTIKQLESLLLELVRTGALRRVHVTRMVAGRERTYAEIELTELGRHVMHDRAEDFRMTWPLSHAPRSTPNTRGTPRLADDLYAYLTDIRRKLAEAAEVPAYVVAPNRTLREIATQRPVTPEAMMGIHGMGPSRFERFGRQLLDAVRVYGSG